MNNLNISDRLEKVANCVCKGSRVADIGCDHAYTAIYLMKNTIARNVVALDINKGPLERAKKNIETFGLEQVIDTRLSDGGKELRIGEVDTLLISGMGGRLTNKILEDSIEVVKNCKQLVLQPQSEIYLVREYLDNIGYRIIYEDMLIEDGKFYVIIDARNEYYDSVSHHYCGDSTYINNNIQSNKKYKNKELFDRYGEYLLVHKNETLYKYLNKNKLKIEMILAGLNSDNNTDRIKELNDDLQLIREGLKYYEV